VDFLNVLNVDHLVLELAHWSVSDLDVFKDVECRIKLRVDVVDVKVNHIETADEIAARIERRNATGRRPRRLGTPRLRVLDAQAFGWPIARWKHW
jgi:5-methyltetrahydropteroyltriglutamate--homocysteine methyltransferase